MEPVIGEITITIDSVDRKFQYEDFGLSYESTDDEIVDALTPNLRESEGFNFKEEYDEGAYTIKRMDASKNIYIFPKSTAGGTETTQGI